MKAEIVESKETKSGKRCCTVTCLRTEYDSETQEIDTGTLKSCSLRENFIIIFIF